MFTNQCSSSPRSPAVSIALVVKWKNWLIQVFWAFLLAFRANSRSTSLSGGVGVNAGAIVRNESARRRSWWSPIPSGLSPMAFTVMSFDSFIIGCNSLLSCTGSPSDRPYRWVPPLGVDDVGVSSLRFMILLIAGADDDDVPDVGLLELVGPLLLLLLELGLLVGRSRRRRVEELKRVLKREERG